jgi:hypothetical protein
MCFEHPGHMYRGFDSALLEPGYDRNMSGNSRMTWRSLSFSSIIWCKDALMREIAERWMMTLPYTVESKWTNRPAMSETTLCSFIQLIPKITSIPWPLSIMRLVQNILPDNSSGTFWTIRSASTQLSGALITYGAPKATTDNFAFLAQVEQIKSCDSLESNRIITGCSLRKNYPLALLLLWESPPLWYSWHG